MSPRPLAAAAALVAAVLVAGCSSSSHDRPVVTVVTTTTPGVATPAGAQPPAASGQNDQPGAPSAPPVEGAYAGAGGPRPADAEPLPTYTSIGVKAAALKTPTGGIGCDFSAGATQGGCSVKAYRTSKLYGCSGSSMSCTGNSRFNFSGGRVQEISASNGPSAWEDASSHPEYQTVTVPYGKVVYFDDWVCASASNGLTCWNTGTGSGVFLSNERAERFDGPGGNAPGAPGAPGAPAAPAPAQQQPQPQGGDDLVLGSNPSNGSGYGTARPANLDNGGSRTGRTEGITWTSWGGERAEGTAQGPNAMGDIQNGAPSSSAVSLVSFDIGTCAGKRAYRQLAVFKAGSAFDPATAQDVCWTER